MLSPEALEFAVSRFGLMKFFPGSNPKSRSALAVELAALCSTDEQLSWLVQRVLGLFPEWPGPQEIRAVYCSRHKPLSGPDIASATFPEGVPRENPPAWTPAAQIETRPALMIEGEVQPPEPVSADPALCAEVHRLAQAATMPVHRRPRTAGEIADDLYKRPARGPHLVKSFDAQLAEIENQLRENDV